MDSSVRFLGSEVYRTKAITWKIKSSNEWQYSSPVFCINNYDCSLRVNVNIDYESQYDSAYEVLDVELRFCKSYAYQQQSKFIVVVYFGEADKAGYTFNLFRSRNNNQSFIERDSRKLACFNLSSCNCLITAVIFYQKSGGIKSVYDLVKDMRSMLKDQIYSDFKIKAGDKVFNVHRNVIAARSSVLRNIVESNMKEKQLGMLELKKEDPATVQVLLDYLYTTHYDITIAPVKLFKLAHMLELNDLQINCVNYLLNNIHMENIINILELTSVENYNLEELHDAAMDFVGVNEEILVKISKFQEFLCNSIQLVNISYILRVSYTHKLEVCLNAAMAFIKVHYKKLLNDDDFRMFLYMQPSLTLKLLEYCLDSLQPSLQPPLQPPLQPSLEPSSEQSSSEPSVESSLEPFCETDNALTIESNLPSNDEMQESSLPSNDEMQESSLPSNDEMQESSLPSNDEMQESSLPSNDDM